MTSLWAVKREVDGMVEWLNTVGFGWSLDKWFRDPASAEIFTTEESARRWAREHGGALCELIPRSELDEARREVERLSTWVNDLQSGMYVNCVYCGHRYGPQKDTPVTMADTLKAHIETCPKHPLSEALAGVARWNTLALGLASALCMAVGEEDTNENILAVVAEAEKGMNAALEAP